MIIVAPADAFILQWHYHYWHNCIFKPPRECTLVAESISTPQHSAPGAGMGVSNKAWYHSVRVNKTWTLLLLACPPSLIVSQRKRKERHTCAQKALQNETLQWLAFFSALQSFENTFSNLWQLKFLTCFCHIFVIFSIFGFQLCDIQTTFLNALWRAFLCFLLQIPGENSIFLLHPTLLYIVGYTLPEGNSSSSDRRNLINNHSHFYFALSLILISLHSLNLRHRNQNFIKKEKWALEYYKSLSNIWNSNKKIKFNVLIIHCVQEIKVAFSHNYSTLRQWKSESHLCCHNIITNFTLYLTPQGRRQ